MDKLAFTVERYGGLHYGWQCIYSNVNPIERTYRISDRMDSLFPNEFWLKDISKEFVVRLKDCPSFSHTPNSFDTAPIQIASPTKRILIASGVPSEIIHSCSFEDFMKTRMCLPDKAAEYAALKLVKGGLPFNMTYPLDNYRVVFWPAYTTSSS